MPSDNVEQFLSVLRSSKYIIAIAGAGLSAASGIPTFRDAGGLWKSHDPTTSATPQAFADNPSRVWQFYHYRREIALKATPNAAHYARVSSSHCTLGKIYSDHPKYRRFKRCRPPEKLALITSPKYMKCMDACLTPCTVCSNRENNTDSPICPALGGTEDTLEDLPRCRECDGLLRPGVVWFDEVPHHLGEIWKIVDDADFALIVGTSSTI